MSSLETEAGDLKFGFTSGLCPKLMDSFSIHQDTYSFSARPPLLTSEALQHVRLCPDKWKPTSLIPVPNQSDAASSLCTPALATGSSFSITFNISYLA